MDIKFLEEKAREIRISTLDMVLKAGSGHLGGSYSCADILVALYYGVMRKDSESDRDRFVLSKGHANPALYAILINKGYLPIEAKDTLRQYGSPLQGHPDSAKCPGLDCSTGSLGQGISVATGMALGLKKASSDKRVFVVTGDGEIEEGICWEAFMAAAQFKLDNLTVIIDRNGLQLSGPTAEIMDIENLKAKMEAFGFDVEEIDGHSFDSLIPALEKRCEGKPRCVIAKTVKGKGVSYMENRYEWHGAMPKGDQIEIAYRELGGQK